MSVDPSAERDALAVQLCDEAEARAGTGRVSAMAKAAAQQVASFFKEKECVS